MILRLTIIVLILNFPWLMICELGEFTMSGCGTKKSCLRWTSCTFEECQFGVSWKNVVINNTDYLEIELIGQLDEANGYIAIGFSYDNKMGDDGVVGCYQYDGGFNITAGYNYPAKYNSFLTTNETGEDFLVISNQKNTYGVQYLASTNRIKCRFARLLKSSKKTAELKDLTSSSNYFLVTAIGPVKYLTGFSKHKGENRRPTLSSYSFKVDSSYIDSIITADYNLVKCHGCLMIIGWILFLSNGIIIATFFKQSWPRSTWCGKKIWFQLHRTIQSIGVICVGIGFIIIFAKVGGFSNLGKYPDILHPIFGIIAVICMFVNPIMALFRCTPTHERRPIFNWAHFTVGAIAFILAITNIGIGLQLPPAGQQLPSLMGPIVILIVFAVLWLCIYVYGKVIQKVNGPNSVDISIKSGNSNADSDINTIVYPRIEIIIASLICSIGFGIALITLVIVY